MLRPLLLAILSCAGGEGARAATPEGAPAALRLESVDTGRATDAYAIVDGARVFVAPSALAAIGLTAFSAATDEWIALAEAPGVTVTTDLAAGVASITCTAACYAQQSIGGLRPSTPTVSRDTGAFFNVDGFVADIGDDVNAVGLFELGVFGAGGFGETSWTAGAGQASKAVRLDTRWTWDDPAARIRYRIGDSVGRSGAVSDAFRFAGVQVARDFTLEPGFVSTPTPALAGVAAMPSVVDLYIDGALRLRERVEAGPFTIVDPPVITGAGAARVVVTDVLGREQVISQSFYGGRAMLRPGLSDFAASVGVLRERFALESNDYAGAIASGVYRRGLTRALTVDVRADAVKGRAGLALGASWTPGLLGQFDASVARGFGDDAGMIGRLGWSRGDDVFSFSADLEAAEEGVTRIGAAIPLPRTRSAFSAGYSTRRGSVSLSATHADRRDDNDISTAAIDIMPAVLRIGVLGFSVLYADDGDSALSAAVTLSAPFGATRAASAGVSADRDGLAWQARAEQTPLPEGGMGWRLGARGGDSPREEAAIALRGRYGDAGLEASRAFGETGVRAQAAFGLVWIDSGLHVAAAVRESFALVDAGAPDVHVLYENRRVGVTGPDGLLLLSDLRPYDRNRIGLEIDDLPLGTPLSRDAFEVTPAARSGVVVRFPVDAGAAGEVRVVDETGAPLPAGAVLTVGARRHPVGREGRLYVSGVTSPATLRYGDACVAIVDRAAVDANAAIVCRRPG